MRSFTVSINANNPETREGCQRQRPGLWCKTRTSPFNHTPTKNKGIKSRPRKSRANNYIRATQGEAAEFHYQN